MGEKPLGRACLDHLLDLDYSVVAIATRKEIPDAWWGKQVVREKAIEAGIPLINRKEIIQLQPDILISVVYPFIIEPEVLESAGAGFNLHGAPLPEYKGCHPGTHALIKGDKKFGATLHELVPELDKGRIVEKRYFDVTLEDTSATVYGKMCDIAFEIFKDNVPNILSGDVVLEPVQDDGSLPNTHDSIVKELPKISDRYAVYNYVRALDFRPFEPASFVDASGAKIELRAEDFDCESGFVLKDAAKEVALKEYLGCP